MDITPLIFVCHDLGGVILKEVLGYNPIVSAEMRDTDFVPADALDRQQRAGVPPDRGPHAACGEFSMSAGSSGDVD